MATGVADHGKDLHVKVNAVDLTTYTKTHSWEETPDVHDKSGSGSDDKTFRGGQIARAFTLGGWIDDSVAAGPRLLRPLMGTTVAFEWDPSGVGTGKAKRSGNVVVGKYAETSKNDDIVQWTCDFQITGTVTDGTQT